MDLNLSLTLGVAVGGNLAPTNILISASSAEEILQVGMAIGTLSAVDPDSDGPFTFSEVADPGAKFTVVGDELRLAAALDHGAAASHQVTIRATDPGGKTFDKTFTISVIDVEDENETDLPADEPTDGDDVIPDDASNFEVIPVAKNYNGDVRLLGKSGGVAKFIKPFVLRAGYTYTLRYSADWSKLSDAGRQAFIGFGFKLSNDFHFTGLKGNGAAGIVNRKIYGAAKFDQTSGFTLAGGSAAAHGSQSGPNWLRLVISEDGTTYTLSTSADGSSFSAEFSDAAPTPLATCVVLEGGLAVFLENDDKGEFVVTILDFEAVPPELFISGTPVTTAFKNNAYTGFSVAGDGGVAPLAYSVASGSLPTGITLNSSTGAVSGTPTGSGTSSGIVIRVTDAVGQTVDLDAFDIAVDYVKGVICHATGASANLNGGGSGVLYGSWIEDYDPDGMMSDGTKITFTDTSYWAAAANLFASNVTSANQCWVILELYNGSNVMQARWGTESQVSNTNHAVAAATGVFRVQSGWYLQVRFYSSDTAIDVSTHSRFSARKLGT